jgi:hypothetical protein
MFSIDRNIPKLNVAGSIPFSRSNTINNLEKFQSKRQSFLAVFCLR